MESSRRQQAQADLGMDFAKEDQKREAALAKEQARADKKAAKREKMMNMPSYRLMVGTAKYMDMVEVIVEYLSRRFPDEDFSQPAEFDSWAGHGEAPR